MRTETCIGRDGEPVRALALGGGGFETAIQLGVFHALLVSRAAPPDVVVGISAGAVNAVVLAEVLEAGPAGGADRGRTRSPTTVARVARLREVLEAFREAPWNLFSKLVPDSYQVDAKSPLEPLKLPIHHLRERAQREDSLGTKSGLIHLYNQLLRIRISLGTVTRLVRGYLGIRAANAEPRTWAKLLAFLHEGTQLWLVLGANLHRLAPVALDIARVRLPATVRRERGASAGEIVFRRPLWGTLWRGASQIISLALLASAWIAAASVLLVLLPAGAAIALPLALRRWNWRRIESLLDTTLQTLLLWGQWIVPALAWLAALDLGCWLLTLGYAYATGGQPPGVEALVQRLPLVRASAVWTALVGATWVLSGWIAVTPGKTLRRILHKNGIGASLLDPHPLREIFVSLFDPTYYGEIDMTEVAERAFDPAGKPSTGGSKPKTVGSYAGARSAAGIHVGIVAADLERGELEIVPEDVPVVDALLAATAAVPFFPPQVVQSQAFAKGSRTFVDGSNVANEPIRSAITFLRRRLNPESSALHLYCVSPRPVNAPETHAGDPDAPSDRYEELVEVVGRARELQRLRDAKLERRLTQLYSDALGESSGVVTDIDDGQHGPDRFLRAEVIGIEPDEPLEMHRDLLGASSEQERRRLVAEAIADGCRLALQKTIAPAIERAARRRATRPPWVSCRTAVQSHLLDHGYRCGPDLPGASHPLGPGLIEVCEHCKMHRRRAGAADRASLLVPPLAGDAEAPRLPEWPAAGSTIARTTPLGQPVRRKHLRPIFDWPRRSPPDGDDQAPGAASRGPTVSFLFSGGVFRGVFQIGVLNALSEVGLRPDIVAGASVGSIVGAMTAAIYRASELDQRRREIAAVAATFLAVDRLILTDRFADAVREFTIRAAQTSMSLRDMDRVFRQYDSASPREFSRESRRVLAGFERLLYVSPFELTRLVRALRLRDVRNTHRMLRAYFQELLDRSRSRDELLGAEPLKLLIREHVLRHVKGAGGDPSCERFDTFLREAGILLLATATNLTCRRLEILGRPATSESTDVSQPCLLEGLLASSAFPGVFRPRWSREVQPEAMTVERYVDGGVMDNLPLDAVAEVLFQASQPVPGGGPSQIAARPEVKGEQVPHLLLTASLHATPEPLSLSRLEALRESWPDLAKRARTLNYNDKAAMYRNAQRSLRRIYRHDPTRIRASVPLDLEVVIIEPRWLVGTFEFHPMLGFSRRRQAESIAHGCYRTLETLHGLSRRDPDQGPEAAWLRHWGVDPERLPPVDLAAMTRASSIPGACWYRPGILCPFSREALRRTDLPPRTSTAVAQIHELCGKAKTHEPRV
jgi:predicted acylesterase/phospholipase RssA